MRVCKRGWGGGEAEEGELAELFRLSLCEGGKVWCCWDITLNTFLRQMGPRREHTGVVRPSAPGKNLKDLEIWWIFFRRRLKCLDVRRLKELGKDEGVGC